MSAERARLSIAVTGNTVAGPSIARRPAVKTRHLLAALGIVLACLALGIALRENQGSAGRSAAAGALAHSYRQEGLLSLPAGARAPVSAALGEDTPAYRVTAAAGGYRAYSPAQRLALRFTRTGASASFRHARLGLALRDIGYGNRLRPVGASEPKAAANRVSYALGGGLRESYANGPLGLEQGFDVERAPAAGPGPLTLSLAVSGNLRARLASGGVSFTEHGAELRYAGLVVRDARGHKLRAWLELRHERVLIRIADRGARYPLRIDPLVQNGELTPSGQTTAGYFGNSVAVSGNTIVVGAYEANDGVGAVYVFTRPASGWAHATQTAELTPSDPENGSNVFGGEALGSSVAIDGSTIVAGAPYWSEYSNSGNVEDEGAVYEYTLPKSGVWTNATQTAILSATNLTNSDYLGLSVAVQGSTIVAGAPAHTSETPMEGPGEVYVYTMPASGGWVNATQTAELSGFDDDNGNAVGGAVAISGSTIVAGAPQEEYDGVGNNESRGGVYVWTEPASGGWTDAPTVELTMPSDLHYFDQLGSSVAVSGSTIVAGAPDHTPGTETAANQGAVYVWTLPPVGGWADATQPAELTASDAGAGGHLETDNLGRSVAVSGSTIFGGAPGHQVGSNMTQGAVYEWTLPASGFWADETQSAELTATDGAADDAFGKSLADSQGTIAVGAPFKNAAYGAAYVFGGGYTMSGTISESCGCGGIGGVTVLVTGTASDGSAVSVTGTSADETGAWSVPVPPGTYTAGPSEDGATFGGLGFDPAERANIAVSTSDVENVNFSTCLGYTDRQASAADASSGLARDPIGRPAGVQPVTTPTQCKSIYKVTVGGEIPQHMLVDPGEGARYNEHENGSADYRDSTGWWNYIKRSFPGALVFRNREYPGCFTHQQAFRLSFEGFTGADMRWYSYIQGPAELPSVTFTFARSQNPAATSLISAPQVAGEAEITKWWVWKEHGGPGGRCSQTAEIPVFYFPVPEKTGFTIVVAWGFPFSGGGAQTNLNLNKPSEFTEAAEEAAKLGLNKQKIGTYWDHATYDGKFALHLALEYAAVAFGAKVLDVAAESAATLEYVSEGSAEYAASGVGLAHKLHSANDINEIWEFLNSSTNETAMMEAVIRADFQPVYSKKGAHVATVLALSEATNKFPSVFVKVVRSAFTYNDSKFPAFSGALPWHNLYLGTANPPRPATTNIFQSNPPSFLNVSTGDYASGTKALERLHDDTDDLGQVTSSIKQKGNLAWNFLNEQDEAPNPDCSLSQPGYPETADSDNTICWRFDDGDA